MNLALNLKKPLRPLACLAVPALVSLWTLVLVCDGADEPVAASRQNAADQMTLTRYTQVAVEQYPWGWIRWTMNGRIDKHAKMTFGVVFIKPHQTNALHLHPAADEILHVVEGSCEHRVGDKWVTMKVGDTIRIPHGVPHNARTADEPCRVVVVYDTPERQMVPVTAEDD